MTAKYIQCIANNISNHTSSPENQCNLSSLKSLQKVDWENATISIGAPHLLRIHLNNCDFTISQPDQTAIVPSLIPCYRSSCFVSASIPGPQRPLSLAVSFLIESSLTICLVLFRFTFIHSWPPLLLSQFLLILSDPCRQALPHLKSKVSMTFIHSFTHAQIRSFRSHFTYACMRSCIDLVLCW
jgi:hypothetical protein